MVKQTEVVMEKKDIAKALLFGAFSIGSLSAPSREFDSVDVDSPVVSLSPSKVEKVVVKLRPISREVGSCFDSAGNMIRSAMEKDFASV